MLEKFDALLLEKIEKFAHWWQKNICGEQNCFWWARVFTILSSIQMAGFGILGLLSNKEFHPILAASVAITVIFPCFVFFTIKLVESRTYQNSNNGLANEFRLELNRLSILMTFIGVGFGWGFYEYLLGTPLILDMFCLLGFFCLSVAYYFMSCDPLPPAKSKVKVWLENLAEKTKEFLSPEPELVPVPIPNNRPYR